jgi:hypothetical protein
MVATVRSVQPNPPVEVASVAVQIFLVHFGAEMDAGDDPAGLIRAAAPEVCDGDVLIVTQKGQQR